MPSPIVIAEYSSDWVVQFEVIKAHLSEVLGSLAVAIEHVGSTSVPGLAAKPILDIDMAVPTSSDVPEGIARLSTIGYAHRGDLGITGREAFEPSPGYHPHHPYLLAADSREFRRHIAFRNRLRSDEQARQEYEQLKRKLAVEYAANVTNYSIAKTEFVERILAEELGSEH